MIDKTTPLRVGLAEIWRYTVLIKTPPNWGIFRFEHFKT